MITNELISYIRQALDRGLTREQIKIQLLNSGWQEQDIKEAFEFTDTTQPATDSVKNPEVTLYQTTDNRPANKGMYPTLTIDRIQNPKRLYSIPIFGFLLKYLLLIPAFLWISVINFGLSFVLSVNGLIILFTGSYWQTAYNLSLGYIKYYTKVYFFLYGLTNKYPGFNFSINDNYDVAMDYPQEPSRPLATPVLGLVIRSLLLIPFQIYQLCIQQAAAFAIFISGAIVFFTKQYPETTFELVRDSTRLSLATVAYLAGLSDTYPSFWISMNHKDKKITLVTISTLFLLGIYAFNFFLVLKNVNQIQQKPYAVESGTGIPNIQQMSNKAGFQILLPKTLPPGFSYSKYSITSTVSHPNINTAHIILQGKNYTQITISESNDLTYFAWYSGSYLQKFFPEATPVSTFSGQIVTSPLNGDSSIIAKEISWLDQGKSMIIDFSPSNAFTNEDVTTFANSFYPENLRATSSPSSSSSASLTISSSPTQTPATPTPTVSPFKSAGQVTLETGINAEVKNFTEDQNDIFLDISFTNTSSAAKSVHVGSINMRSQTLATANKNGWTDLPLDPSQTKLLEFDFEKSMPPPYTFTYTPEASGSADVTLGWYTPQ